MAANYFQPNPPQHADLPRLGRVCRLGLATRGNTGLDREMVLAAIERGVDYLNWCGHPDGMRDAIRALGPRRQDVKIAVQFEARSAAAARRELDAMLGELATDYLDVATCYYVEHVEEWDEIVAPGGAAEVLEEARAAGRVRAIGLTSHQRPLAARIAAGGRLDLLMIRYNAAYRGAERDIFPVTLARGLPVVAFTCTRWGALMEPTPDDPPGFTPPRAPDCYRFVLASAAVSVALAAPDGPHELAEDLSLLTDWRGLSAEEHATIAAHGERVRRHAGQFP
ncbi:MAG: aldo/keto reductase [Planctomycetia bacterium]|nr:aldo/keto reductase [Planctomycetia bacterium]